MNSSAITLDCPVASSPLAARKLCLPATGTRRLIQGVEYFHTPLPDGGDLFLTRYGRPFAAELQPENWLAPQWFESHRRRLRGTSTIYRTQTQPVRGRTLDVVVRFSRVGEDIPVDPATRGLQPHAAFNTPFEEFASLMALRSARLGPDRRCIRTKRPLAIYSPATRLQLWQTGRNESEMASKQARLTELQLDIRRAYILIYGWIRGIDAQEAADQFGASGAFGEMLLAGTVEEVNEELRQAGFRVLDMKPAHIIVRFTPDGQLLRRKDGRLVYGLVDYELLEPCS